MFRYLDRAARSAQRWHSTSRAVHVVIAVILLGLMLQTSSVANVETLPPPLCTESTERGYVDVREFLRNYVTPAGHFTIWFELESQRVEDPNGTCFPVLYTEDNALKFVENVGALLEQVYSFYAGDYATTAFSGLGFDLPPHVTVSSTIPIPARPLPPPSASRSSTSTSGSGANTGFSPTPSSTSYSTSSS